MLPKNHKIKLEVIDRNILETKKYTSKSLSSKETIISVPCIHCCYFYLKYRGYIWEKCRDK